MLELTLLLKDAITAALQAGKAVMQVYDSADFEVELKSDQSPLTLADRQSHTIIKGRLAIHGLPMISEEGRDTPYPVRRTWERFWMIDPLDGTKEFIKRNGEFTVNVALIEQDRPVLGVVYAPVPKVLYFAEAATGAFKIDNVTASQGEGPTDPSWLNALMARAVQLPCAHRPAEPYTIVGSRSHATDDLMAFVEAKKQEKGEVRFVQAGSSLKICLVAEGAADIYPRLGPTMEWDTAAGQAVAEMAGAGMRDYHGGQRMRYNKQDLLNPWFVVER